MESKKCMNRGTSEIIDKNGYSPITCLADRIHPSQKALVKLGNIIHI